MLRVMDQQLSQEHEPWNMSSNHAMEVISKNKELPEEPLSRNVTMRTSVRVAKAAASRTVQKLGHLRLRSQVIPRCSFKCCHVSFRIFRELLYFLTHDMLPLRAQHASSPSRVVLPGLRGLSSVQCANTRYRRAILI